MTTVSRMFTANRRFHSSLLSSWSDKKMSDGRSAASEKNTHQRKYGHPTNRDPEQVGQLCAVEK